MLGELPNSFIKRRLGWASGTSPHGLVGGVWYVVDQVDLVVGCWLVTAMLAPVTTSRVLISLVFVFVFHQLITVLDYLAGIRRSLR